MNNIINNLADVIAIICFAYAIIVTRRWHNVARKVDGMLDEIREEHNGEDKSTSD